jgi:hypothetical protein
MLVSQNMNTLTQTKMLSYGLVEVNDTTTLV